MIALLALKAALGGAWGFIRTLQPTTIAIAILAASLAFCWHGWHVDHNRVQQCATGRAADHASYVAAQAQATRIATDAKAKTEARYAIIQKDHADEISHARDDARAAVSQWVRTHPVKGDSSRADLPSSPDAASIAFSANTQTVVPAADLQTCADNTITAEGWAAWWTDVSKGSINANP